MKPAGPYNRATRQRAIARSCEALPSTDDMVTNILAVYAEATIAEREVGEAWYWLANVEAERVSNGHPNGPAIVAALSPQNSWGQNLNDVTSLLAGESTTQTDLLVGRATAILEGGNPADILGGRKTRAFWRNIQEPDRSGPVTVDRHAVAVAYLGPGNWTEQARQAVTGRILERIGAYHVVSAAYRGAARKLGLRPHELQAVVWLTWRRSQNIGWRYNDPF